MVNKSRSAFFTEFTVPLRVFYNPKTILNEKRTNKWNFNQTSDTLFYIDIEQSKQA